MKLVVQIPCLNEEATLPAVLSSIPLQIEGIASIITVVIDDGSTDRTVQVAESHGVHEIVRNTGNLGLAFAFRKGIDRCLALGADIIVNLDGDNQYRAEDIPALIKPILDGKADMVVGDRDTSSIRHFSPIKKFLQWFGSAVVRKLSGTSVIDATSGFRAFSREAALKLTILSNYTYTHEAILQARAKGLIVKNVRVRTNPKTRESRLMRSLRSYLVFSLATIIRVFTMYNPLRLFIDVGALFMAVGVGLAIRFLYFYLAYGGSGKIQSLIFAAIFLLSGALCVFVGLLADIIQFNRRLLEDILERVKKLELRR